MRAARSILGALLAGALCYAAGSLAGRACTAVVDGPLPGDAPQVSPWIRALDAGTRRDR